MGIYLGIYVAALIGLVTKSNRTKISRKHYLIVIFGLLTIIGMLRNVSVGTDLTRYYGKYYPTFQNIPWNKLQSVTPSGDWELGFCALCKCLAMISPDVQLFIAVTSILSIVPYGIFIYKNSRDVVFSTIMYIAFHIYTQSFNVVRQAIAVGFVLLALDCLKRKSRLSFVFWIVIATLFHTTAIVAIVYLIIEKLPFTKISIYLLGAFTLLLAFGYRFLFELVIGRTNLFSLYGIYSQLGQGDSGGYITYHTISMFLIALIIFVVACMYLNKKSPDIPDYIKAKSSHRIRIAPWKICVSNHYKLCYWSEDIIMYSVYMAVLFRFMAFIINVTSRFSLYFFPFLIISLPNTCAKLHKDNKRIVYGMMYYILTAFFFWIGFYRAESLWGVVPYSFFWQS